MLGAATVLALGGTTTAAASNGPGTGETNAPGQAHRCERLGTRSRRSTSRETRLEARIARVQEKIATGDLTEKRLERAKKFLAHLENRSRSSRG